MTATTERPAVKPVNSDKFRARLTNRLTKKYDPADIIALSRYMTEDNTGAGRIDVDVRPARYVDCTIDGREMRLTIKQARKIAEFLYEACDQLEAGRGTV